MDHGQSKVCTAVFLLCLWQCLYCLVKFVPRVGPAPGNSQVFRLVFNRVVDLVPVRDTYPAEILQEFSRMAGASRPLVFIQDNLPLCIHPPGTVYPHAAFAPGRTAALINQHGRFIRLQHMVRYRFEIDNVNGSVLYSGLSSYF